MSKIIKKTVVQYECTDGKAFADAQEAQRHQMKIEALAVLTDFLTKPDIEDFFGECGDQLSQFMVEDWEAFEYLVNGLTEALKPKIETEKF